MHLVIECSSLIHRIGMAAAAGYIYFAMVIKLMVEHGLTHHQAITSFTIQGQCYKSHTNTQLRSGIGALMGRFIGTAWLSFAEAHTTAVYASTLSIGMLSQVLSQHEQYPLR